MPKNKKILIIEDDKFLGKMLGRMLEDAGYEVLLAVSGKEGLNKLSGSDFNLILLDIMLPDIDGFDVLNKIKKDRTISKIPVIIMSNLGQPEDIKQGKDLGAIDYIVKSDFSLDEVSKKIQNIFKES